LLKRRFQADAGSGSELDDSIDVWWIERPELLHDPAAQLAIRASHAVSNQPAERAARTSELASHDRYHGASSRLAACSTTGADAPDVTTLALSLKNGTVYRIAD
jgi:hypothetical protein